MKAVKLFLCIFFIGLFSQHSFAAGPRKIKNKEDCVAYFPFDYPPDVKWEGRCNNGLAEGKIKFSGLSKGKIDTANFVEGYIEGEIVLTGEGGYYDKCRYIRSELDGLCTKKDGNYRNYISRWKNGAELEGSGYKQFLIGEVFGDKTRQEGEFYGGMLNGYGKLYFSSKLPAGDLETFFDLSDKKWRKIGDQLVAEGLWQNGRLVDACNSQQECRQLQSRQEAQKSLEFQKRNVCEAQKQTCLSGCPSYYAARTDFQKSFALSCESKCGEIRCN